MKTKWFVIVLAIVLAMCAVAGATPIRHYETVDEWATINQNAIREGSDTDISDWDVAWIHISSALTGEVAHTGTMFYIQISASNTGDRNWTTFSNTLGPVGTANDVMMTASITSGTTTIYCSDTSGKFDDDGIRLIFIQGSTTVASSSLVILTAHGANASLTIMEGAGLAHTTNTRMFDCASTTSIQLPKSAVRARVIYDNTYDSNGASVTTRCDITGHKE